ncbi:MAG: CPBP family intramembrane metalloprotease [Lachnospiraceae bacterium]|nr:CPBP family intramembrane metalloprotease [Lachnospiraceae bacterium]
MRDKILDYKRYLAAFLIAPLFIISGRLILNIILTVNPKLEEYSNIVGVVVALVIGLIVVVIILLCKGSIGRFTLKSYFSGVFFYMLPFTLFCLYHILTSMKWIFIDNYERYTEHFLGDFITELCICIMVAITEEIVCRCAVLNCLLGRDNDISKKKIVAACIYSAILFGLIHMPGYFAENGASVASALWGTVLACLGGYIFAVIYLKTKNIFSVMTLHFGWDFALYCKAAMCKERYRFGGSYNFTPYQTAIIVVMVIIATIVLFKSEKEELLLKDNCS